MKKIVSTKTHLVFAILIAFYACSSQLDRKYDDGVEKEYPVTGFSYVTMGISAHLYYEQADNYKVVVKAKESVLDNLEVEVDNGKLKFYLKKPSLRNTGKVEIFVSSPEINGFSISGSGNIVAEKAVKTEQLELKVSGSGDIKLNNIHMDNSAIKISGSGSIYLNGDNTLDECSVIVSGSGNIYAKNLKVRRLSGKISGSGKCECYVTDRLDVKISGSGSFYYFGQPQIDASISGSGRVKPLD